MFNSVTGVRHSVAVERFLKQEQGCTAIKELATLNPENLEEQSLPSTLPSVWKRNDG